MIEALFPILKCFFLFTLTGLSLFRIAPRAIQEIHSWTDRILLSLLTGIAFFTIFFFLAMGLVNLPLTLHSVGGTFLAIILLGVGFEIYRRKKHLATSFEQNGYGTPAQEPLQKKSSWKRDTLIAVVLGIIFFFALHVRIQNQLNYPDKLLDADPYRHHIRTEALLEKGYLSKFDPYLVGEVPIFEIQGCYLVAGILAVVGPISPLKIWLWGSQIFGALGVLSLYLLTKLSLQKILERDLAGSQKISKKKKVAVSPALSAGTVGTTLGLLASALLAASPIHILRTSAGFSEAFAIPMLAPTLLFYLWAAQSRVWGDFVWFGIFFSAVAFNNPQPAIFLVPFFLIHAAYVFIQTRDIRWILGNMLAAGIFFSCLLVWKWKFLAVPLSTTLQVTSEAGTAGIQKLVGTTKTFSDKFAAAWDRFTLELLRNLNYVNLRGGISRLLFGLFGSLPERFGKLYAILAVVLGTVGSLWVLRDGKSKKWNFDVTSSFFFLFYFTYLFLLLLVPLGWISFTDKYYRYLLPLSLGFSISTAYFIWRAINYYFTKPQSKKAALIAAILLSLVVAGEGRSWGGWVLNCTPAEYAAADWIKQNTQPADFIIANWYTGDYLRSLTKRRIIISNYPRVEVKLAMKETPLTIPILPNDPQKVVDYARQNPGGYYLVQSKWGPWAKYSDNPHFKLVATFGDRPKEAAKIYRIEP